MPVSFSEEAASIEHQLQQAKTALSDGNLAEAESNYRNALKYSPGHRDACLGIGHCARLRGDREAAFAAHNELVQATGGIDPWSLLQAAFDLHVLGRLDEAERAYRAVLNLLPNQRESLLGIGQCARLRNDRNTAAACHQTAAMAFPDDPEPHLQLAFDLQTLHRLDEAEAAYRAVLALDPAHSLALLGIGHCARHRGNPAEALAAHQAAFLVTGDQSARLQTAIDLQTLGRSAEAANIYRAVLVSDPTSVSALLGLGRLHREGGQDDAALDLFRHAAAQPGGGTALIEYVLVQFDMEGADTARQTAEQVLIRVPSVEAALALGVVERQVGRYEQALAAFNEARRLGPERLDPLLEMAATLRSLGRQADCDRLLAKAVRLDPDNLQTLNQLAYQAMLQSNPVHALTYYERAIARYPLVFELQLAVAEALAVSGRPQEAFARLDELPEWQRVMPIISLKRIDILHRCGFWHEALHEARMLTRREPYNIACWIGRSKIELFLGNEISLRECLERTRSATGRERVHLLLLTGLAAERNGDAAGAAALLHQALDIVPNNQECLTHLVRLALLEFDIQTARRHLVELSAQQASGLRLQRRSANPSQTLFGQILDDYALDETVAVIRPILNAATADRLPRLLNLVLIHPDSTAAAVATLQEMTRLGLIASQLPFSRLRNERIPRRITQFWDKCIPSDVADIMRSWPEHNPAYKIHIFDRAAALAYLRRYHQSATARAFEWAGEGAQAADLFRLAYLSREGGIYVDADDRCLMPIDYLLPSEVDLVLYQEDLASVGNNFIAAVPGHAVIRRALALATEALCRGDADIVWLSTGPGLLTRALAQSFAEATDRSSFLGRVTILNRYNLFPVIATHCLAAYKFVGRHWSRTAFGGNITNSQQRDSYRWSVAIGYSFTLPTGYRTLQPSLDVAYRRRSRECSVPVCDDKS